MPDRQEQQRDDNKTAEKPLERWTRVLAWAAAALSAARALIDVVKDLLNT